MSRTSQMVVLTSNKLTYEYFYVKIGQWCILFSDQFQNFPFPIVFDV